MVDFTKFSFEDGCLLLDDGIFTILGRFNGQHWNKNTTFCCFDFQLYIKNNDGGFVLMGSINDEKSLETILNLIEHGEFFPNNILQ